MSLIRSRAFVAGLAAMALAIPDTQAQANVAWPPGELSRHVQAWFAQLTGDAAAARKFFAEHFAPAALADAPVETRLQRRTAMLERTQGLTPLEVLNVETSTMDVRCTAGNGDEVTAIFEAEDSPPHRLVGVRLEATPPGGGDGPRLAGPRLDDAEVVKLAREHLDARAAAGEFSGVALLVRGDSTLLAGAWGHADREAGTKATLGTRFNLASIGKVLTRTAIAQLALGRKLSLDDKLSRFLPDFPRADEITIDMLCEHRSGVGDIFNPKYQAMDRSKLRHNRDYLELIRDQPLWFEPGKGERYSNGGYVLLGEVIAKASGEDYYDYLAKHVFARAGMKSTGAPIEGDGTKNLARGYTGLGAPAGKDRDNTATRPARGSAAGGLYSTAADLVAFDRALLAGDLCGKAWAGWVTGDPRPDRVATTAGGPKAFGFAGGAPGISSHWQHEDDAVLILLTNRDPEVTAPVMQPLRDLVRRMKSPARKVRS
jgi:CubicO group peptidase (beta-lactamase class C family)